jgi:hypothetical protein
MIFIREFEIPSPELLDRNHRPRPKTCHLFSHEEHEKPAIIWTAVFLMLYEGIRSIYTIVDATEVP